MRINRLDLTRYGKFTDAELDFGAKPQGSPDLHIVYGPNEAGKSTTLDAILDLIFGMGATSRYGFLHPYPTMRVGANITASGVDREFVRIKRPQNSLLDSHDRPLPDNLIRADLGGIDRDAFGTMFSLDDETLEKGGEGILASKGDLGQLLFSASAGLSELSRELTSIRTEADGFYKYRARSGLLLEQKAKLASLKSDRDVLDVQASDHARLVGEKVASARRYEDVIAEQANIQRRIEKIRRVLGALTPMSRLAGTRDRLAATAESPDAPESWKTELPDLRRAAIEYDVTTRELGRAVADLEQRIAAIVVDEQALRIAEKMDELSNAKARYTTAELDIPRISAKVADLSIDALLLRLGKQGEPSPERLVLDAAAVGRLRGLIASKSGIDATVSLMSKELGKVEASLAEHRKTLGGYDELSEDRARAFEQLSSTLKNGPRADDEWGIRSLTRGRDQSSAEFRHALSRLSPWRGSDDDLAAYASPSTIKIDSWKSHYELACDASRVATNELERLKAEALKLDAESHVLQTQAGDVGELAASTARSKRDEAWAVHRNLMDPVSADAFQGAMDADDKVTSRRLLYFSEIGRLHQLRQRRAAIEVEIEICRSRHEKSAGEVERIRRDIGGFFPWYTASDSIEPADCADWLLRRDDALRRRQDLEALELELADAIDRLARYRRLLTEALARATIAFDRNAEISSLIALAEGHLDEYNAYHGALQHLERLEKEFSERLEASREADAKACEWTTSWNDLCKASWLVESGAVPSPDAVVEVLAVLELLATALDSRQGYVDRIQKMESDQIQFANAVHEICTTFALPVSGTPGDLFRAVSNWVSEAVLQRDRRAKLEEDLVSVLDELQRLSSTREITIVRHQAMLDHFHVSNLDEVEAFLEILAQRRDLETVAGDLEQQIVEITGEPTLHAAEQLLATSDRSELEMELAALSPQLKDLQARSHGLFHEKSKAADALEAVGGDSGVAEIEERRKTLLLEIADGAERYLELRAGVAAAEHGLRIFRDKHRSGMMARASDAFRTISRGAYQGLAAQPGKDGEVLIAVSAGGGSKAANELSKGARFQLYLALRVAGYHEFVATRGAVPFLADDIMETFDDFRAEEAFRLFADMAKHGQVIYLTHHRHLVEIARAVCPTARVHNLDEIIASTAHDAVAAE